MRGDVDFSKVLKKLDDVFGNISIEDGLLTPEADIRAIYIYRANDFIFTRKAAEHRWLRSAGRATLLRSSILLRGRHASPVERTHDI